MDADDEARLFLGRRMEAGRKGEELPSLACPRCNVDITGAVNSWAAARGGRRNSEAQLASRRRTARLANPPCPVTVSVGALETEIAGAKSDAAHGDAGAGKRLLRLRARRNEMKGGSIGFKSITAAAEFLEVSRGHIYNLIKRGEASRA